MPAATSGNKPAGRKIAAVLLAAGRSLRMGAVNKLLIGIGGEPMVRRAAGTLLGCGLDVYAVVGHERENVEAALQGLDLRCVFNPGYRDGQQTSVRAGLAAIDAGYEAVVLALSDQPLLAGRDVEALLEAYADSTGDKVIVPFYRGTRGNPIVIPRSILGEIEDQPANLACRRYTERFPDRVARFEAPNDHFIRDIDTDQALREMTHCKT